MPKTPTPTSISTPPRHAVEPAPFTQGALTQIAPGRYHARGAAPETVIADVIRHTDGSLGLRPTGGRYVKFSPRVAALLGMQGRLKTLCRLATAGFITMYHPSPAVYLLDIDSWFRHLDATAEDPDFWDPDGENYRAYIMKNGLRRDK